MVREKPHKKLDLWKKSIELVVLMYETTKAFPREEEFGLKCSGSMFKVQGYED